MARPAEVVHDLGDRLRCLAPPKVGRHVRRHGRRQLQELFHQVPVDNPSPRRRAPLVRKGPPPGVVQAAHTPHRPPHAGLKPVKPGEAGRGKRGDNADRAADGAEEEGGARDQRGAG